MPRIISFINLKGGVAKTTTTVGLATTLSGVFQKRVLVVDLDPQTNCTTMLISEQDWVKLNREGLTLHTLFSDAVYNTHRFDIGLSIQKNVSNIREVKSLDLLPSSPDLTDIQDKIIHPPKKKRSYQPAAILRQALEPVLDAYDYILLDCPPNLSCLTENGLVISDGYIIPTIPDVLSTYGIPQILNKARNVSRDCGRWIRCYGIVITKYREQSRIHKRIMEELDSKHRTLPGWPPLFETVFYETSQLAEAAEYTEKNTLKQKWGYNGPSIWFESFAKEIMEMEV